jgi:hypothetical protein
MGARWLMRWIIDSGNSHWIEESDLWGGVTVEIDIILQTKRLRRL